MKILKNKKFYLFLGIVIIFFGLLFKMNYSVDTYLLLSNKLEYVKEYLNSGRIFTYSLFYILSILHVSNYLMYLISYILGIIILTISIYELNKILDKYVDNIILSILLSIFIIINPFIIELWLFIESGIMMLSILSCIIAYKYFDRYLENKNKKNIIYSMICVLLGLFSYQGTIALFIALSLFSIIKYSKNIKEFMKNNIIIVLIYGIPSIINYLFIILFSTNRVGGNFNISKTINAIISNTGIIIDGFGLYFKGILTLILIISIIISIYYVLKDKKNKKIIYVFYIILMIYIFTILPIIPQTGDRIAIYPRTCYVFFSLIGILFIYINNKKNYKLLNTITIILLVLELLTFTRLEINRFKVNSNDKEIVLKIEEKVIEYENKTGIKVNKLAIYNLEKSKKFYDRLDDRINVSAVKERPSGIAIYNYYTNRKLEYVEPDNNIYNEYFINKKSNNFSLNQVIVINDTIHWYLY